MRPSQSVLIPVQTAEQLRTQSHVHYNQTNQANEVTP